MNRDKQIEEMAKDLENHTCMSEFQAEIASRMLYAKGYRKSTDLAREVFEEIDTMIFGSIIPNDCAIISTKKLAELKKKYTEVE